MNCIQGRQGIRKVLGDLSKLKASLQIRDHVFVMFTRKLHMLDHLTWCCNRLYVKRSRAHAQQNRAARCCRFVFASLHCKCTHFYILRKTCSVPNLKLCCGFAESPLQSFWAIYPPPLHVLQVPSGVPVLPANII